MPEVAGLEWLVLSQIWCPVAGSLEAGSIAGVGTRSCPLEMVLLSGSDTADEKASHWALKNCSYSEADTAAVGQAADLT